MDNIKRLKKYIGIPLYALMIPDISSSKYRTILLLHWLKKSEGGEARSPENFGWGCVPCVLKP